MQLIYLAEQKVHLKWMLAHDSLGLVQRTAMQSLLLTVQANIDQVGELSLAPVNITETGAPDESAQSAAY